MSEKMSEKSSEKVSEKSSEKASKKAIKKASEKVNKGGRKRTRERESEQDRGSESKYTAVKTEIGSNRERELVIYLLEKYHQPDPQPRRTQCTPISPTH
jgi:hypothetical protein